MLGWCLVGIMRANCNSLLRQDTHMSFNLGFSKETFTKVVCVWGGATMVPVLPGQVFLQLSEFDFETGAAAAIKPTWCVPSWLDVLEIVLNPQNMPRFPRDLISFTNCFSKSAFKPSILCGKLWKTFVIISIIWEITLGLV